MGFDDKAVTSIGRNVDQVSWETDDTILLVHTERNETTGDGPVPSRIERCRISTRQCEVAWRGEAVNSTLWLVESGRW
jgi:hypothetical protein